MPESHTDLVKRVVRSLSSEEDRESALVRYLDHDREMLVASIVETLHATRQTVTEQEVEERLEQEILADLRWQPSLRGPARVAAWLWVKRRAVGVVTALTALAVLVGLFLL